MGLIFSACNG